MKSSEALKCARVFIECGDTSYVCTALEFVNEQNTQVAKNLKELFGPYKSVTTFLWTIPEYQRFMDMVPSLSATQVMAELRDYRLRWIDWMIPQYEEKGGLVSSRKSLRPRIYTIHKVCMTPME